MRTESMVPRNVLLVKKCLNCLLFTVYVDEPADIEPKDEELDPVDGFMKLSSTSPNVEEIMLLVDGGNNDVVMHDANDVVQVEHVIDSAAMCTDIVDLVFDNAMYKVSELYKKDLEILRLQKLLTLEKINSKRKVKEACDLGKASMEEMAVRCEYFHQTILSTIYAQLQRASKVSSVDAIQNIRQSEFFKQSMKDLTDLAKVTVTRT